MGATLRRCRACVRKVWSPWRARRIGEGKVKVENHEGPTLRGPSEKDLGIFAEHKVNRSQLGDADFPKLISLQCIHRRITSRS